VRFVERQQKKKMQFDNQSLNAYLAMAPVDPDSSADDDDDVGAKTDRMGGETDRGTATRKGTMKRVSNGAPGKNDADTNGDDVTKSGGDGGDDGEEIVDSTIVAAPVGHAAATSKPKAWGTSKIVGISIVVVLVVAAVVWTYRAHVMPSAPTQSRKSTFKLKGSKQKKGKETGKGARATKGGVPKAMVARVAANANKKESVEKSGVGEGVSEEYERIGDSTGRRIERMTPKSDDVKTKPKGKARKPQRAPVRKTKEEEEKEGQGIEEETEAMVDEKDRELTEKFVEEDELMDDVQKVVPLSKSPFLEPFPSASRPHQPSSHRTSHPSHINTSTKVGVDNDQMHGQSASSSHNGQTSFSHNAQTDMPSEESEHKGAPSSSVDQSPTAHKDGGATEGVVAAGGEDEEDDAADIPDDETIAELSKEDLAQQIKAMYTYDIDMRQRYKTLRTLHLQLLSQTQAGSLDGSQTTPKPEVSPQRQQHQQQAFSASLSSSSDIDRKEKESNVPPVAIETAKVSAPSQQATGHTIPSSLSSVPDRPCTHVLSSVPVFTSLARPSVSGSSIASEPHGVSARHGNVSPASMSRDTRANLSSAVSVTSAQPRTLALASVSTHTLVDANALSTGSQSHIVGASANVFSSGASANVLSTSGNTDVLSGGGNTDVFSGNTDVFTGDGGRGVFGGDGGRGVCGGGSNNGKPGADSSDTKRANVNVGRERKEQSPSGNTNVFSSTRKSAAIGKAQTPETEHNGEDSNGGAAAYLPGGVAIEVEDLDERLCNDPVDDAAAGGIESISVASGTESIRYVGEENDEDNVTGKNQDNNDSLEREDDDDVDDELQYNDKDGGDETCDEDEDDDEDVLADESQQTRNARYRRLILLAKRTR
jgi:hypothetical protein